MGVIDFSVPRAPSRHLNVIVLALTAETPCLTIVCKVTVDPMYMRDPAIYSHILVVVRLAWIVVVLVNDVVFRSVVVRVGQPSITTPSNVSNIPVSKMPVTGTPRYDASNMPAIFDYPLLDEPRPLSDLPVLSWFAFKGCKWSKAGETENPP